MTRRSQQARHRPHAFPRREALQRCAPAGALSGLEEMVLTGRPYRSGGGAFMQCAEYRMQRREPLELASTNYSRRTLLRCEQQLGKFAMTLLYVSTVLGHAREDIRSEMGFIKCAFFYIFHQSLRHSGPLRH